MAGHSIPAIPRGEARKLRDRLLGLRLMTFALGVERSAGGQPWKWRRSGEPGLTMDALVDELLLARGVARDDLERHRKPTIRDFLPDPSCFQDMDKGAKRLADAVAGGENDRDLRRL